MLPLHFICAYVQSHLAAKKDDEGATAVEYGLLVTLIAVVLIAGATIFGNKISAMFTAVGNKLVSPS
ncbi:Flp family type IVb pilin [Actinoplanes bogorensis]|uniref:Flp family type IVb pilin n=1 Tax=Paractinoplanes bogorensis TaxID=1610840 RepID=A0ABS5YL80_9ACTN|nr:Flp family type IVb pilin [Actinoplanes bogorensis]MBU2664192.1 Flp family type IVb pilin [Actinoplanes bogorensis]